MGKFKNTLMKFYNIYNILKYPLSNLEPQIKLEINSFLFFIYILFVNSSSKSIIESFCPVEAQFLTSLTLGTIILPLAP